MAKKQNRPTTPRKVQMRSIVKGSAFREDVTLAEYLLLETLRTTKKASKSRKAYRVWDAWQCLKNDVYDQHKGRQPSEFALKSEPERFAAVAAIVAYLDTLEKQAAPASCEHEGKQAT